MSRQNRLNWVANGSPWRLMQPARELRDVLRGYGYTVYDIGNQDHLEADPPEDHAPYSATGYPRTARYGVGYALDIMPPTKPRLPSLQQLGAQLLADRNAGVSGIRWLKYMNWEPQQDNGGSCYQESWQPHYARRSSGDRGHIHLSGLTGFEDSTVGAGYDPVARIRGEEEDFMAQLSEAEQRQLFTWVKDVSFILWRGGPGNKSDFRSYFANIEAKLNAIDKELDLIAARTDIDPTELAAIRTQMRDEMSAHEASFGRAAAEQTVDLLGAGEQTPEEIAELLRAALGDKAAAVGSLLAGAQG